MSDTAPTMQAIEDWAAVKSTPDWAFAVAKLTEPGWGVGKQVDEATFDAAIVRAGSHLILAP